MRIGGLIVWLLVVLAPSDLPTVEPRPRSILALGQSDLREPFYSALVAALLLVQGALISILLHERETRSCAKRGARRSGSRENDLGRETSLEGRGAAAILGDALGGEIAGYRLRR